jgi:hypothetical protein
LVAPEDTDLELSRGENSREWLTQAIPRAAGHANPAESLSDSNVIGPALARGARLFSTKKH